MTKWASENGEKYHTNPEECYVAPPMDKLEEVQPDELRRANMRECHVCKWESE